MSKPKTSKTAVCRTGLEYIPGKVGISLALDPTDPDGPVCVEMVSTTGVYTNINLRFEDALELAKAISRLAIRAVGV